jgi:hypothetical protein
MFLKKIMGLAAFGAFLIVTAPPQQAHAAILVSPSNAVAPSDASKLTTKVHHINEQPHHQSQYERNLRHRQQHWRNHHHDPQDHYNQHHPHDYYNRHYQHDYYNHYHHGR